MFRQIGPAEIMIILAVAVLLFGGRKLPEVARGSGRALRIFKSEIKGLHDDEDQPDDGDSSTARDGHRSDNTGTSPETGAETGAGTGAAAGNGAGADRDGAPDPLDSAKDGKPDRG